MPERHRHRSSAVPMVQTTAALNRSNLQELACHGAALRAFDLVRREHDCDWPIDAVLGGFYEFAKMTRLNEAKTLTVTTYLLIVATSLTVLIPDADGNRGWFVCFKPCPRTVLRFYRDSFCSEPLPRTGPTCLTCYCRIHLHRLDADPCSLAREFEYAANYLLFLCFAVGVTDISAFRLW